MSTYMNFLSDEEREITAICESYQADMMVLESMLDTLDVQRESMFKQAEAKVLMESGTSEDLTELFQEADEETSEKKKGIFATIIDKIAGMFRSIKNFIMEKILKKEIPDNKQAEINKEDEKNYGIIMKVVHGTTGFVNALFNKDMNGVKNNAKAAITGFVALGGFVGAASFAGVKIKKNAGELKKWVNSISTDFLDKLSKVKDSKFVQGIEEFNNLILNNEHVKKAIDWLKKFAGYISDFIKRITASITSAIGAASDAVGNAVDKVKDKLTGGKNEDNNDANAGNDGNNDISRKFTAAIALAKRKRDEMKHSKDKARRDKWFQIKKEYDATIKELNRANAANDSNAVNNAAAKLQSLFESSYDIEEYICHVLESTYEVFGEINQEFVEFVLSYDISPTSVVYELASDDVDEILGYSNTNDIYDERAIQESTEELLEALDRI